MRGVSQTEEAGAACSRPQTQRAPVGGLLCVLSCHHTQGSLRPASQAPSLTWAVGSPGSLLEGVCRQQQEARGFLGGVSVPPVSASALPSPRAKAHFGLADKPGCRSPRAALLGTWADLSPVRPPTPRPRPWLRPRSS